MILDLDLCRRLKAAGFPQDGATLFWVEPTLSSPLHPYLYLRPITAFWCAAPEALDVLDWFEREKGFTWWRTQQTYPNIWLAQHIATDEIRARTAPELIAAILKKLEGYVEDDPGREVP